ncbi:MAG: glycosyltransferase [Muribaculaceae bacterium]|nr:glycosyltransferase [Muribaculaceae bacterium]
MKVRASIVTYQTDIQELTKCIRSLQAAGVSAITIVDNSPTDSLLPHCEELGTEYIFTGKNLGYGAAHNIALRQSMEQDKTEYHLVINSDVYFDPHVIARIVTFMDSHPEVGQLIPRTVYPDGREQAVVRMLPTPLDVFGRRFLPARWMRRRNSRYLLEHVDHTKPFNVAYHQGSFMFLRLDALREVGLFDERFFMYPEDIDLTRRVNERFQTLFWPDVTITHAHRAASYKSLRMLRIHCVNMIRYFNKWGWFIDPKRREINRGLQKV